MALLNIDELYIKISPAEINEKEKEISKDLFTVEIYKSIKSRNKAKSITFTQDDIIKDVRNFLTKQSGIIYNELYSIRKYSAAEIHQIKADYINFNYKNTEDRNWCIKAINDITAVSNDLYVYENITYDTDLSQIKFKKLHKLYPGILKSVGNIVTKFNIYIPNGSQMSIEEVYNYVKDKEYFGITIDC